MRRSVWPDLFAIALASWLVLFVALRGQWPVLRGHALGAAFLAGVVSLVAYGVLTAARLPADPWRIRNRSFEQGAAWLVSGALVTFSLFILGVSSGRAFLGVLVPVAVIGARLGLRRLRSSRPTLDVRAAELVRFLEDASLPEKSRAELLRQALRDAEPGTLRPLLEAILEQPLTPTLEAAVFAGLEETARGSAEPLLLELLARQSPEAQARTAHLLSWFGTPRAVASLREVEGPASDAALAALGRIKNLHGTSDDAGRLSLSKDSAAGELSIQDAAGGMSLARVPAGPKK